MLQTLGRWAARVVHARYARNVKLVTLAVAGVSGPAYAIDDETAFKVVDGTVEVVSEGHWKLLTP